MIRPELQDSLHKWREVLLGLGLALFGAWWTSTASGAVAFLGYGAIALGVVLMIGGWQRIRFRRDGTGPGVVQVVERRVAYFGPLEGGTLELDDLATLDLDGTAFPTHWILRDTSGGMLRIPVNAAGADVLFDAFSALPKMQTEALLRALEADELAIIRLWGEEVPLITH